MRPSVPFACVSRLLPIGACADRSAKMLDVRKTFRPKVRHQVAPAAKYNTVRKRRVLRGPPTTARAPNAIQIITSQTYIIAEDGIFAAGAGSGWISLPTGALRSRFPRIIERRGGPFGGPGARSRLLAPPTQVTV